MLPTSLDIDRHDADALPLESHGIFRRAPLAKVTDTEVCLPGNLGEASVEVAVEQ